MEADALTRDRILARVEDDRVHRDLYLSDALFALEQRHFFANTWNYLGHATQVPERGDFIAVTVAGQPLVMVRHDDGNVRVLFNRCAHKGTRLVTDDAGNVGRLFRCPYHAWTYRLDGSPLAVPLKAGYEGTRLAGSESGQGMGGPRHVAVYRDFVFVKLGDAGPGFDDYFGPMLRAIDDLADRSPVGRLRIEGGCLRNVIHCNWKIYLENINDTVHPLSTHESATAAARAVWEGRQTGPGRQNGKNGKNGKNGQDGKYGENGQDGRDGQFDAPKPMAIEQILPFAAGYAFFDEMGGRIHPNGHSVLGTRFSIHSRYGRLPEYEAAMREAHGDERATEVLERAPQNATLYPSLALKGSPQTFRVIRPLAVDRTLVEAWSLRAEGAPEILFQRSMTYNRLVFSPLSVVAHDDVHLFESIQQGLRAGANDWVSLHRDHRADEPVDQSREVNGTNEWLMRNQFRAWARFMTMDMAS